MRIYEGQTEIFQSKHTFFIFFLDLLTMVTFSMSKQMYVCLVPTCKEHIRGDKLRDHYKKFVRFGLLEETDQKPDRKLELLNRKVI